MQRDYSTSDGDRGAKVDEAERRTLDADARAERASCLLHIIEQVRGGGSGFGGDLRRLFSRAGPARAGESWSPLVSWH